MSVYAKTALALLLSEGKLRDLQFCGIQTN